MPALLDEEQRKAAAAERALGLLRPGMVVGLGSGTTAAYFVRGLGRLVVGGLKVVGVPTSREVAALASDCRIPLLERLGGPIDLAVDGADEIDAQMNLVKGGGGAHFREKLVAGAARRFVVVADASKLVERLGRRPVPVEVLPFMWRHTAARMEALGCHWALRGGEERPFQTDNGNLILDLTVPGGIADPGRLGAELKAVTGVLEHGLFVGMAAACLIGGPDGVEVLGQLD